MTAPPGDDRAGDGGGLRPTALLGGLLVLGAVGAFAWLASDRSADVATSAAEPAALQAVRLPVPWGPVDTASAVREPVPPTVPRPAAASAPAGGDDELCGVGRVTPAEMATPAFEQAQHARVAASRAQLAAALEARGDEASRAAALALKAAGGAVVLDEVQPCTGADCPATPVRTESAAARVRRLAEGGPARDALVQMALGSRSSAVYGLALAVCGNASAGWVDPSPRGATAPGACGMLSADQWARLDPANGAAWLAVAEAADRRRDRPAVAEALHQLGLAQRLDAGTAGFLQALLDVPAAGVPPFDHFAVAVEFHGSASTAVGGHSTVVGACSATAVADANRRQLCDAAARVLLQHGTQLMDLGVGAALGARAGWPPERVAALRMERAALQRAAGDQFTAVPLSGRCAAVQHHLGLMRAQAAHGELGSVRRHIAGSGRSLAAWAQASASQPGAPASSPGAAAAPSGASAAAR